jgi:predicted  nucleic acid-binding Zn-ribbon protein
VNADHPTQLRLLDLQAADTSLAQLAHRRRTMPELAAIADRDVRIDAIQGDLLDAETQVSDLAEDQKRFENEVDSVRAREVRDEQRLQAGGLPPKDLEGLQHELTTLKRRQSALEDDLLEVMERREAADDRLAVVTEQQAALERERTELIGKRDAEFTSIDAATATRTAERAALAAGLPADLVALYEKARAHSGGTGAAVLRQRRCEGCRIELSASELSAVRSAASDAVVRCENCRCILVRTDESGL